MRSGPSPLASAGRAKARRPASIRQRWSSYAGRCAAARTRLKGRRDFSGESVMQADEAAELMEKDREQDVFKQRAAVAIACFAMVLAICGLGGGNATKEA